MATTPKAVQRQLAQAEAILASQAAVPQPTNVIDDVSQLQAPAAPAPAPVATPAAPEVTPPPAAPATPPVDYEQKFKTLQGMFNAEVPRWQAQSKTLESENVALKEQIRALTEATKAAKPEKAPVDPKDAQEFGADVIEMVQRYATASHEALRQEFDARLRELEAAVNGVSKKAEVSLEQQFYATLTKLVPDWEAINTDERWLAWLSEKDPTFGVPRQAALSSAHQSGDAGRVAQVFNLFLSSLPKPRQETLAEQAAPVSAGSAPAPVEATPAPRQMLSQKFVQTFYRDVALGRYKGREAEVARVEAEINSAAAEGRIL